MHAFKSQAAGIRPITIEDCNDSPSWDRGAQPGSGSVDYPEGGCRVSGGGYYRIGAQADSALWEWGRARRGEAQGEGGGPVFLLPFVRSNFAIWAKHLFGRRLAVAW